MHNQLRAKLAAAKCLLCLATDGACLCFVLFHIDGAWLLITYIGLQVQNVIIKLSLLQLLYFLIRYKIVHVHALIGIEIVYFSLAKAWRHRLAQLRGAIVEAALAEISLLTVEGGAIAQIVLVPVLAVYKVFATPQRVVARIQGLKSRIKVQRLIRLEYLILMVGGGDDDGAAADAIVERL